MKVESTSSCLEFGSLTVYVSLSTPQEHLDHAAGRTGLGFYVRVLAWLTNVNRLLYNKRPTYMFLSVGYALVNLAELDTAASNRNRFIA